MFGNYLHTVTLSVEGLHTERFINAVYLSRIEIFKLKITGKHNLVFTVNNFNAGKVFAICEKMCYNVKVVKQSGVLFPFKRYVKKAGLILGSVTMAALVYLYNGYIFNIKITGTGVCYSPQITERLSAYGIKTGKTLKSTDINLLEKKLLKDIDGLMFVSIEKKGSTLIVNAERANDKIPIYTDYFT